MEKDLRKPADYPKRQEGDTYQSYRKRVDNLVKKGLFQLNRLTNTDWSNYCLGEDKHDCCNNLISFQTRV